MLVIIQVYLLVVNCLGSLEYTTKQHAIEKPSQNLIMITQGTLQTVETKRTESNSQTNSITNTEGTEVTRHACRDTAMGETYTGTVSHTAFGAPCLLWVNANQTKYKDEHFPDGSMPMAVNFCRNPDRNKQGIWCYLKFKGIQYRGHCNAPYCGDITYSTKNCKTTKQGSDYVGNISHTIQGHQCQAWHKQRRYSTGRFDYEFPDNDIHAANSFCRNPSSFDEGPWCYTTEPGIEWKQCGIPICNITEELNNVYMTYHPYIDDYTTTKLLAAANNIRLIYPPFIKIFGTFTNILSIKVFLRPSLK